MSEVVVVGGGIVGCATAIELMERGSAVTLVEAEQPGVRATGASGGMLAPQYEAAGPSPAFLLGVRARDGYAEFVRRIEELADWPVGYRRDGMLVANRTPAEDEQARDAVAWQAEVGQDGEVLTSRHALELHPGISPRIQSWHWLPNEAQVDAQRLAVALGAAVKAAGVRLRLGQTVTGITARGGRATGVRTASGDVVSADFVILAAGAWSSTIAGVPRLLPVRPVRGQILRLRPDTIPGWTLVATHTARYLVPRENGTVLVGSTMEDVGYDELVTEEARLQLAEHAAELVPTLAEATIVERWAGLRPLTTDGWPIVGPDPDLAGLFYATGHGRNGILLGPLTARIISDLVLENRSAIDWQPLRPERFDVN